MSDIAYTIQELKTLDSAKLYINEDDLSVSIYFTLHNSKGRIDLKMKPTGIKVETLKKFRRKIYAAAMTMTHGKRPESFSSACRTLTGTVSKNVLKIFLNLTDWEIVKLNWAGVVAESNLIDSLLTEVFINTMKNYRLLAE